MSFLHDLKVGQTKEDEVIAVLSQYFDIHKPLTHIKEYDIHVNGTMEIKYDRKAIDTDNFAIEIMCRKKPSGLATSTAQSWMCCTDEGCWLVPRMELYDAVTQCKLTGTDCKIVMGGDDKQSEIVLIPYSFIKSFKQII